MTSANEPAFPQMRPVMSPSVIHGALEKVGEQLFSGLTKRELFAAMAMQGWLSSWPKDVEAGNWQGLATKSVTAADALLAALSKVETKGTTTSKGDVEK